MNGQALAAARIHEFIAEEIANAARALPRKPDSIILAFKGTLAVTITAGRTAAQVQTDAEAQGNAVVAVDDAEGLLEAITAAGDWLTIHATPASVLVEAREIPARPPTPSELEKTRAFEEARQYPAKLAATYPELIAVLEPPGSQAVLFESGAGRVRIQREIGGASLALVKQLKTGDARATYSAADVLAALRALRKNGIRSFVLAFATGKPLVAAADPQPLAALAMPLERP